MEISDLLPGCRNAVLVIHCGKILYVSNIIECKFSLIILLGYQPPTRMLHFFNAPRNCTLDQLKDVSETLPLSI